VGFHLALPAMNQRNFKTITFIAVVSLFCLIIILLLNKGGGWYVVKPKREIDKAFTFLYKSMDKHRYLPVWLGEKDSDSYFSRIVVFGDRDIDYQLEADSTMTKKPVVNFYYRANLANGKAWAGISWQDQGDKLIGRRGINLEGRNSFQVWARGEKGGEKIEIHIGGVESTPTGLPADSIQPAVKSPVITLTKKWKKYTISLKGQNLSNVVAALTVIVKRRFNPSGARFYLAAPAFVGLPKYRLIQSYPFLEKRRHPHLYNAAFVYDNALALIAFASRGSPSDWQRAKILADSLIYLSKHDPDFLNGLGSRLRDVYSPIQLIKENSQANIVDPTTQTGNLAWVILALCRYYEHSGKMVYLREAEKLADWIVRRRGNSNGYTGDAGGESKSSFWKSTEHNLDIAVAFQVLARDSHKKIWAKRANIAKKFVSRMWDKKAKHFWIGTVKKGKLNKDELAIDANLWPALAFSNYKALPWTQAHFSLTKAGISGFDYDTDKDSIWLEGTAYAALAYLSTNSRNGFRRYNFYLKQLVALQNKFSLKANGGVPAAYPKPVSAGSNKYPSSAHLGATAWYIFVLERYNPFTGFKS
jgi:hypothetical protein